MCFTLASGCTADSLMFLSFIRRMRAQLVLEIFEEDCGFTPGRLSEGDDVDAVLGLGMDDRDRNAFEQAQRQEALFLVTEAVIFVGELGP